jgi:hypothetical protein
VILTPIRAPNANAFDERWVQTVRAECLDWMLILGRRHLDRVEHYNGHRAHRALGLAAPLDDSQESAAIPARAVHRRNVLGGLIHEYHQMAACRIRVLDPRRIEVSASVQLMSPPPRKRSSVRGSIAAMFCADCSPSTSERRRDR